jgi:hypothetical protein
VLILIGILAHALPAFGLQLRKLAQLGPAAPIAGTILIVTGAIIVLYVTLLKGRMLWVLLGSATLVALGIGGLLAIGWWQSRSWSRPPPTPGFASGPPAFAQPPWGSGQPRPAGPSEPVPKSEAWMVSTFGADRVVRIEINAPAGVDIDRTFKRCIDAVPSHQRPGTWQLTRHGTTASAIIAPIADLNAAAAIFTAGRVTILSEPGRRLHLTLDPARSVLVAPKP